MLACVTCNSSIRQQLYNSMFYPNLLVMLSAFIVLAVIVYALASLSRKSYNVSLQQNPGMAFLNPVPLTTAAMVLGIGMGGFIDGIVLHQLLQWHGMLTNKIAPVTVVAKSVNMFWDGLFHLFTLAVVCTGVVLQWKLLGRQDINRSGKLLWGGLLSGWGLFNIVEGVIDHHILKLHNIKEITPNPGLWNYGFLILSVVMMAAGFLCIRSAKPEKA